MSTSTDLKQNIKPAIRKISKTNHGLSLNIPLEISKKAKFSKGEYMFCYLDTNNKLIFEPVKIDLEESN